MTPADAPPFVLRCAAGGGTLTLTHDGPDDWRAELELPHLRAETSVCAYRADLGAFLANVASQWRGWEGLLKWETLEGELRLRLASDRLGHVAVTVTLRESAQRAPRAEPAWADLRWSVEATLVVGAGELEGLARAAAAGRF